MHDTTVTPHVMDMWHGRMSGYMDCALNPITPLPALVEGALGRHVTVHSMQSFQCVISGSDSTWKENLSNSSHDF